MWDIKIGTCILYGFVLCHVTKVWCQTNINAMQLRSDLFASYDRKVRPALDQTEPVDVYLNFILLAINGLDEVNEVLKTTGYLSIYWVDGLLKWTPKNYGGISYAFFPQGDVWKPDVALVNSNKEYKELGVESLNVRVDYLGSVQWLPFQVFESTCSMNIKYFPFDVQTCSLKFVAWSYSSAEVEMLSGNEGLILKEYSPNSAWDILETSWHVEAKSGEAAISFNLKMKRKPLYIILSVILPITLLAVLNIFVFVLPCDSGERAGYAVTVFLALAVFLTIVSATLPANSETVAVFSVYLIIQTVQSTVITLIALFMLRLNSFDENTKIPSCLLTILKFSDRLKCKKGKRANQVTGSFGQTEQSSDKVEVISLSNTPGTDDDKTEEINGHNGSQSDYQYTWTHVIYLMDVICMFLFSTILIVSTALCFGISTLAEQ